ENSRDGANDNWSWNCGVEGDTDDPDVRALRLRQAKNLFVLWAMSQGTPMMLMGDEVLRSQRGNNNAYCQDNELSWFDWQGPASQKELLSFVQQLIALIQNLNVFKHDEPLIVTAQPIVEPAITWHGVSLGQPDWGEDSRSLAFTLSYRQYGELLHVIFNAFWEPLTFELPSLDRRHHWQRVVDTALGASQDFCQLERAPRVEQSVYQVAARSSVILMANSW
ncbi:MAG: glycogen debranching enzyme, partial [Cyanobacteria bacterium J06588_5]